MKKRPFFHALTALISCGILLSACICSPDKAVWAAGAFLLISALHPHFAVCLFLAALPVFGNRPGSPQTYALLLWSAALVLGAFIRGITAGQENKKPDTLMTLTLGWTAVGVLSLTGLPLADYFHHLQSSIPSPLHFSAMLWEAQRLAHATEETIHYSLLSVVWSLLSLQLFLLIRRSILTDRKRALHYSTSILFGLIASLAAGLLDYYQLINLRFLRALDPVVNPLDVQFRLQSFFGHSGWFAEFVTIAMPFAMCLLLLPLAFRLRVSFLLALMVIGEFVLILTFQRGGWISYPLTLFVIWSAVYVTRRMESGEKTFSGAFRRSMLKVALSLPITVLLSLAVVWTLARANLFPSGLDMRIARYTERFKDIGKASDRTSFMRAGYLIGSLNPILGSGSESFAFQYRREFTSPEGRFYGRIDLPLHGSAHNVYAQTFAGKGAMGVAIFLALLAALIVLPLRAVLRSDDYSVREKALLLVCASVGAAIFIYGHVQEIFYVQSLQFLLFATLAIASALLGESTGTASRARFLWLGLLAAVAAQVSWRLANAAVREWSASQPFGCYGAESEAPATVRTFEWCGLRARRHFPPGTRELVVVTGPIRRPETLVVRLDGKVLAESLLRPSSETRISIPPVTDEASIYQLSTAAEFIPARDSKDSQDRRMLSYRLYLEAQ